MGNDQLLEKPVIDIANLLSRGWTACNFEVETESALKNGLITLAKQLGTPVALRPGRELCDKLQPTDASLAKPHSLSRKFSLGEFPCHSDTAHWLTPCRFVILACLSPGAADRSLGYKASLLR
jgi:hypothetical protein